MRKMIKEYRAYFFIIMLLLVINILFFFVVTRTTTCNRYNMATECLAECGDNWALSDHLFYCSCMCNSTLGQTAIV